MKTFFIETAIALLFLALLGEWGGVGTEAIGGDNLPPTLSAWAKDHTPGASLKEIAYQYFLHGPISRGEKGQLKHLGLFFKEGFFFKKRRYINKNPARRLNDQETEGPANFFAENMVEFITNPEMRLRRPAVYTFLSTHFHFHPFEDQLQALPPISYKVTPISLEDLMLRKTVVPASIDPNRVYQVHNLFASSTPHPMSFLGHEMYRLVICPEGEPLGEHCLQNSDNDIVVSYRGHVEGLTIDPFTGLLGGYPSKLFIMKFSDVIDEYTQLEDRTLISLPIKMTDDEKTAFLNKVMEQLAEFEGDYKFATENCSTLSWGHLLCSTSNPQMQRRQITSPLGMYRQLYKMKMIDKSLLADPVQKIEKGYYWPNITTQVSEALADIRKIDSHFPKYSPSQYINLKTEQREELFNRTYAKLQTPTSADATIKEKRAIILLSFLTVEAHLTKRLFYGKLRHLQQILIDGYRTRLKKKEKKNEKQQDENHEQKKRFLELFDEMKKIVEANKSNCSIGYGIPTPRDLEQGRIEKEREDLQNNRVQTPEELAQQHLSYANEFLQLIPGFTADFDLTIEKIAVFKTKIKNLIREIEEHN